MVAGSRPCVATELDITLPAHPGDQPDDLARRLAVELSDHDALVLRTDYFGPLALAPLMRSALTDRIGAGSGPVTCVDGRSCGDGLAGIQAHAIIGAPVHWIEQDGETVGAWYEDSLARYAVLGDVYPLDASACPEDQCTEAFDRIESALKSVGFEFCDVVRTWLFANRILTWYDDLNRSRTRFFRERALFGRFVPASTGTGMANDHGTAIVTNTLAMRPRGPEAGGRMVDSPEQCPALAYGSAFSRAAEMRRGALRRVFVSGTASITKDGRTQHVGHVDQQIVRTMEVVEALLAAGGCDFDRVCRAIVYAAVPEAGPAFERFRTEWDLPAFPTLVVQADLCRDDLLLEIELDAIGGE